MKIVTPKGMISEHDAAKMLERTIAALKKWRTQSRGPAYYKVRRRVFYKREDIRRYMETETQRVVPDQERKSA